VTKDVRRSSALSSHHLVTLSCLALGVLITLAVRGYRFGESNHAVYLVDALRRTDPSLLRNDWWANSTLQYHFVFNGMTAALMRVGLLQPAFLTGYLLLAVLLHLGWRILVVRLGGSDGTYLVSVALFYLMAGGVGLGMYHFLQDSAFLPSNVANVAMLWAVCCWVGGRPAAAGTCLGVAGLFHINHALAGNGLWAGVTLFERRLVTTRSSWLIGTLALVALSAVQVVPAMRVVLSRSGKLPTAEFVDLFVRLRHPHHFDPMSWHWGIWLSFLAPAVVALAAARVPDPPGQADARRRARAIFTLFAAMIGFALLTAGVWFSGETFVQLNLYRFSIYPKLLSCVAVAWLLWDHWRRRGYVVVALGAVAGVAGVVATSSGLLAPPTLRSPLGVKLAGLEGDSAGYRELASWARENTPKDAIFLVPPDEESFRVHARRAIVVNFKGVPQLSAELPEWRDRLQGVLGLDTQSLLSLPKPMGRTLMAIRARYNELPPGHHARIAARYGATFAVLGHPVDAPGFRLVHSDSTRSYFLYDLSPEPGAGTRP
jgi:hypothetical protein